jgi:hypothetical protein
MKLGIMQPYFMPYIGYWQLMNAVDQYVIYDDVNFIKGGWINRNRILLNGEAKYFNIQMAGGASSYKHINEIGISNNSAVINKNIRILEAAYKKAPLFDQIMPVMEKILLYKADNLALFIMHSFEEINQYLGIITKLLLSSDLQKDNKLRGQDKVIAVCQLLGADEYYNAIGGQKLYSYQEFRKFGIELKFLKTANIFYKQFNDQFIPNLSMIDILMFNSVDKIKSYLLEYSLLNDDGED